jgi:2-polyprenyl-3-methyl-5-hydroxy-6-metoxy-1,4-benzoquinol methylase
MNTKELLKYTNKPELYEKGTAVMWTDPYISEQLLQIHLNPELDLASRKYSTIVSTAEWVLSKASMEKMNILDLGCGPGLYSEIFAGKGHLVTGVDFSKNSIDYAIQGAENKGLNISYLNQNYLKLNVPEDHFDLATLIYCDLGPLLPSERDQLLANIKRALKPGGILIFDVLNDSNLESKVGPKSWEISDKGFWRNSPYLALSESLLYKEEKVILSQHIIVEDNKTDVYRFWTHLFSHNDLIEIIHPHDFTDMSFHEDVLPEGDIWNGNNVTFCVANNNPNETMKL